jgi:hypothetical protein
MLRRERILKEALGWLIRFGTTLPAAFLVCTGLEDASNHFAKLDCLDDILNIAALLSVPWIGIATAVVILRWRDLPQRFWILYCINALLAYFSLPIYLFHFGIVL